MIDPLQAAAVIRRTFAEAPAQLADGFARAIKSAPAGRLEQVMRSPVRRAVLDGIFWQMPQHLDTVRARGISASIRWEIAGRGDGGADIYDLVITDGRCHTQRGGGAAAPRVTITVDGAEFLRIASGSSDPMRAYFKGRLAIAGDIMVAAKMVSLFRIPGSPRS